MTTETVVPDEVKAAIAEWRKAYPHGVPVLHWRDGDRDTEPEIDFASSPSVIRGEATVRLESNWRGVPIGHVEAHPLAAEVLSLPKPEERELDFPYPPCPFCHVETFHNGDNFECDFCGASFDSSNNWSIRRCVQDCDNEATVAGADGQPRCITCEVRVRAEDIEANKPYDCVRCKQEVVGIPERKEAFARSLCPGCLEAERHRKRIDEILGRRR